MDARVERKRGQRFTLIELPIAIVVVGILAAIAIVGLGRLTSTGGKSACTASGEAATSASVAYYANNGNAWQANLAALVAARPPVFTPPSGAVVAGQTMKIGSWTLTETGGGTTQPTFACS